MKRKTLLDFLVDIPRDATEAVVMGVKMEIIDTARCEKMLESDPDDFRIHECTMQNGRLFLSWKIRY